MGQRLVMVIVKDNEQIAATYHHWSAYTISALTEATQFVDKFYSKKYSKYEDIKLRILKIFEDNGGGIDVDDIEYVKTKWPFRKIKKDEINRNNGLVAFSDKAMSNMINWSEGLISINLDKELIVNDVIFGYENWEEYCKDRKRWDENFDENQEITKITINPICLSFEDISPLINELDCVSDFVCEYDDAVYELIA